MTITASGAAASVRAAEQAYYRAIARYGFNSAATLAARMQLRDLLRNERRAGMATAA